MGIAEMTALLSTLMAPMQAQMQASQTQLVEAQRLAAEKEARILELLSAKPDNSQKDDLASKMLDMESSRSDNLRQMHESEMRQLRENAKEDIKRAENRHCEELRMREASQQREIDNLNRSHDNLVATLKMSYDAIISSLKADMTRIERDLSKNDTELITLRAKKDKTIIEQASEFSQIREALETISGGSSKDDEDDNRKWYEKIISQVTENPEGVAQVVGMVTGGGNPAAQQQIAPPQQQQQIAPPQQQQIAPPQQQVQQQAQQQAISVDDIPIGQPFQDETGKAWMKVPPDGSIVPYEQGLAMAKAAEEKANGGLKKPSASEVKIAIGFMENAFRAGTKSEDFAMSAKSMIPNDILKYMEAVGIDKFLNEVAVLEQGSPLRNQAGRTYIREVGKFLLEGVTG
jgi:hypothetical protein